MKIEMKSISIMRLKLELGRVKKCRWGDIEMKSISIMRLKPYAMSLEY